MADSILKIRTQDGDKPIGYPGLADKPIADKTLEIEGAFADSKEVGERFAKVNETTDSLKEDISNKITKFYASSQGETHLADSDNGKIMDMMLYGKSEQKQYSGKNLLTFQDDSKIVSGITFETKDGIITAKGTATKDFTRTYFQFTYSKDIFTAGETYTFSINSNDNNLKLYALYKANDTSDYRALFNAITNTATVQIPENVDLIIRCVVDINTTVNATATIQIEKGSEATSYEPYTGGQPSPSPDYPQEIKSVVNPTVKVVGKNLFEKKTIDIEANKNQIFSNRYYPKGTYTIKFHGSSDGSMILYGVKKNEELIKLIEDKYENSYKKGKTFTLNEECVCLRCYSNIKVDEAVFQIELGSTPTSYEPYYEQTVTLPYDLYGVKVASGGNVAIGGQQYVSDYFDVERGKLVRMCNEIDLKNLVWDIGTNEYAGYYRSNTFSDMSKPVSFDQKANIIVEKYKVFTWNDITPSDTGIAINPENNQMIVTNQMSGLPDGRMIYVLATPTEIDLTPEEIAAFKALATYYPVTNISVTSKQLDGLTVFNYPISMQNGWNYVKQQLNDNRDYIYDMDVKAQDIDTQSAEAYVNSEYAVALTELEV